MFKMFNMTRQQLTLLGVALLLFLTGLAVKAYRASNPPSEVTRSQSP